MSRVAPSYLAPGGIEAWSVCNVAFGVLVVLAMAVPAFGCLSGE